MGARSLVSARWFGPVRYIPSFLETPGMVRLLDNGLALVYPPEVSTEELVAAELPDLVDRVVEDARQGLLRRWLERLRYMVDHGDWPPEPG